MQKKSFYLLIFAFYFISNNLIAQTRIANNDGNWSDPNTWNFSTVPGPGDAVMIDGHDVTLDVSASVASIYLTNNSGANGQLSVNGGGITLEVTGSMTVFGANQNFNVDFDIESTDSVYIGGTLSITRSYDNATTNRTRLKMIDTSRLTIQGDLVYDYNAAAKGESEFDVHLYNKSKLEVRGNTTFNLKDGNDLTFYLQDTSVVDLQGNFNANVTGGDDFLFNVKKYATANIGGNFTLSNQTSSGTGTSSYLKIDTLGVVEITENLNIDSDFADELSGMIITGSGAQVTVNEDINFTAVDESDVNIGISDGGSLYLAGNLAKSPSNGYGRFIMDENSNVIFSGKADQLIDGDDGTDAGTDYFHFTNIQFINTADSIKLMGSLTVNNSLVLSSGIVKTSTNFPIILIDQATISNGSSEAYIDGPIIKRGRTNGTDFIFPTGNNGTYAPIEIEEVTSTTVEHTAQYLGCPPPIEAVNAPLTQVSRLGYWSLERNDANLLGNVTLHWDNATANGITDIDFLVVSYTDGVNNWTAAGRSNAQGIVGFNQSGSIRNDIGCPPPIEATLFAFGSTKLSANPLPVEMGGFNAFLDKNGSKVNLEWETLSEMNSDYFIIEKSFDGLAFSEIARVQAAGMSSSLQLYSSEDKTPAKGNNYYRIRQVDLNRSTSLSQLVNVFINVRDEAPIIYPNPVKDQFRIYSKSLNEGEEVLIVVSDITGKTLYVGKRRSENDQILLSTANLNIRTPGSHFVSFKSSGQAYTLEILNTMNQ